MIREDVPAAVGQNRPWQGEERGDLRQLYMTLSVLAVLTARASAWGAGVRGLTFEEAVHGVSEECPGWVLDNQVLIDVVHWGFDGRLHTGSLVADARVAGDLQMVFALMFAIGFPLESVMPISQLGWDDFKSMRLNNTSAFNFRFVPFTGRLSSHAYGLAIDINPLQNPYITAQGVFPEGAVYDVSRPGTLHSDHPVVLLFKELGWRWGGDWYERDYQHFDRQLERTAHQVTVRHLSLPLPWR